MGVAVMMSVSGLVPLLAEHRPLANAEAVLLVHDNEREVLEVHALLYEGVRPDDDVRLAGRYRSSAARLLGRAQRARERARRSPGR